MRLIGYSVAMMVGVAACVPQATPEPGRTGRYAWVLTRLETGDAGDLNEGLERFKEMGQGDINEKLGRLECSGIFPVALVAQLEERGTQRRGDLSMYARAGSVDGSSSGAPCGSFGAAEWEDAVAEGPMWIDNEIFESHAYAIPGLAVDLSSIIEGAMVVSGHASETSEGFRLPDTGESIMELVWSAERLRSNFCRVPTSTGTGVEWDLTEYPLRDCVDDMNGLDGLAQYGVSPSRDLNGDGYLADFRDTDNDGKLDLCCPSQGSLPADCENRDQCLEHLEKYNDGFSLTLEFSLQQCNLAIGASVDAGVDLPAADGGLDAFGCTVVVPL